MTLGFAYFNSLTKTLHKQYKYHNKLVIEDEALFNSIVSGLIPFGAIFGSMLAGPLCRFGRRLTLLLISMTATLAILLTLVFDIRALLLGRLVYGL